jgi:cold shock CspA family protein
METFTGKIVIYDVIHGWGFILRDSDGKKIYWHIKNKIRNCIPSLDLRVEFELGAPYKTGMAPQAINLRYERRTEETEKQTTENVIELLNAADGGAL